MDYADSIQYNTYIKWFIGLDQNDFKTLLSSGILELNAKILGLEPLKIILRNTSLEKSEKVLYDANPSLFINCTTDELSDIRDFKETRTYQIKYYGKTKSNGEAIIGRSDVIFENIHFNVSRTGIEDCRLKIEE